ncbi:Fpg/Nei family DNA glycosylase [Filimonas effusa]|uniref:Fpg/Nei family DNA glycosylase n=1 Tax=Filimonas effusa TaxID=2508721 RepID=A0A4Q1DAV3_9BACT|nr:DNA-formamidopyrimidine glycosylase family protein [Filimonas effusa]RXK86038.1 Fpg/Nei family DNA glycosylase [Filimonas effusa]
MPELPDLQVFSSNLTRLLSGKTLQRITVKLKRSATPAAAFKKALEKQELEQVYREGKELHFSFRNGAVLGMHLMLRGQLHLFGEKTNAKHAIATLLFTDGDALVLSDYQGLATAALNPPHAEAPDALSADFTRAYLRQQLSGSRAKIKQLLLNQKVVRGIGNAYADEILWKARISPFSIAGKIPPAAVQKLARAIPKVLKTAEKQIRKSHPGIISGEVRDFLLIHNQHQTHSPGGAAIEHKSSGGRKTYYTREQELFL